MSDSSVADADADSRSEASAGTEEHQQTDRTVPGAPAAPAAKSFDWRGWVLVAALVFALIVIPWSIIYLQQAQSFLESLGLGLRDAYLVLPLIPAMGLGALAVWSAVASRRDRADQQ